MAARDAVVAVTGAMVIVLAAFGVAVVESRAGPYQYEVTPNEVPVRVTDLTHSSVPPQGTVLPGGACLPLPPQTACTEGELHVYMVLAGLPPLESSLVYVAILTGGGGSERVLGAFEPDGQAHVLDYQGTPERQGQDRIRVVVALESGTGEGVATPVGLPIGHVLLAGGQQDVVVQPAPELAGAVTLHQIGAVTVSATVDATFSGLPTAPMGTEYRAWLVDNGTTDGDRYTFMGRLPMADEVGGSAELGGRVERVRLADQETFLVTLEPVDASLLGPVGFPVVSLPLWP